MRYEDHRLPSATRANLVSRYSRGRASQSRIRTNMLRLVEHADSRTNRDDEEFIRAEKIYEFRRSSRNSREGSLIYEIDDRR